MYQGVRYISSQQVAHDQLKLGALGTEMAETRFPTLNLLDAIWVNANPIEYGDPITGDGNCGPPTPYDTASYTNVIGASQDPVAMDYWASKNILIPAAEAKGYTSISSLDPDYASLASQRLIESFHNYLSRSMDELMKAGYQVTMNGSQMNVYVTIPASSTNLAVTNYSIQTNGSMFLCTVQSNSLVSSYIFDQPSKEIKFSVTGDSGKVGVCNVTFPTQLLGGSLTVLIDGSPRPATITYDATHTSIYFTYSHSTHQVEIIGTLVVPEFPSMVANITVLAVLTLMLILKKRSLGARCFFGEN
jgi:hypothetical protein